MLQLGKFDTISAHKVSNWPPPDVDPLQRQTRGAQSACLFAAASLSDIAIFHNRQDNYTDD